MKKYYLTTPLYYVNSKPHIGHSYTNIAADVLARFYRLCGREVKFLTGTDEHGQKIMKAAQAEGLPPAEFTDRISGTFRDLWKTLHISEDDFIRTTEIRHKQAVKKVWLELDKKGKIYSAPYAGYYCTPCETFLTDEVIRQLLAVDKPIHCPDCGRLAEKIEETNYFFKLSEYQDWLIGEIDSQKNMQILPETRRNEVLGFLKANKLQDLCVSRPKNRLAWGIESPLSSDHVTYVWFDALVNYISACGYADPAKVREFEKWWPADLHLIGKDILRHHAIYWTILLYALDLPLPKMIFAHGWWVQAGEKMSKSKGNAVDPVEIVKTYGVDPYRYFLLSEAPFGQDGTFSEEALVGRFNTDLANDLGNLLHRSLTMCEKYFEGMIPSDVSWDISRMEQIGVAQAPWFADVTEILGRIKTLAPNIEKRVQVLEFREALAEIWALVDKANKIIERTAPWTLAKEGKTEQLKLVLVLLVGALRAVAQQVWPFMPSTGESLWKQLGIQTPVTQLPEDTMFYFVGGGRVVKGVPLFPRILSEEEKAKHAANPKAKK